MSKENLFKTILESKKAEVDIASDIIGKVAKRQPIKDLGEETMKQVEKSQGLIGTFIRTQATNDTLKESLKKSFSKNGAGKELSIGAIAGSYMGVSSAYRLLSGGGLYKDKNGNTNVMGIPFI